MNEIIPFHSVQTAVGQPQAEPQAQTTTILWTLVSVAVLGLIGVAIFAPKALRFSKLTGSRRKKKR